MSETVQFVVGIFETETAAEETLQALKTKKDGLTGVQAAVAMQKTRDGKVQYKDVGMTPSKGAFAGVILGAVVGITTGGAGLALGALGALLGGVFGKRKREGKLAAEQINQVLASIVPGSSALLTVVALAHAEPFESLLSASGAQTFRADISAELAEQLQPQSEAAQAALLEQIRL